MNASNVVRGVGAVALISLCTACSTWNGMSRNQKATTEGAATGAVVGGLVGGPVGAAVGAGAGGYVAHEAGPGGPASKSTASNAPSSTASNAPSSASNAPSYSSNAGNNYGSASSYGGANMASSQSRDEIRSVQQTLNDRGYNVGQVDGIMGPHTRSALEQFQQANNLPKNGQLDQQTLAALGVEQGSGGGMDQTASNNASTNNPSSNNASRNNASRSNASSSNASSNGSNASDMTATGSNASDMTANGSNASGMSGGQQQDTISSVQQALNDRGYNAGQVDGRMGPQTRGALEKFQQSNGLKQNGQLDQQTLAALGVSQSNPQQLVNETASNGTGGTSASTTNAIPNASNGYNPPGSSNTASNNNPSNASAPTNDTSNSSNTASSSNPSTSSSTSPTSSSSNDGSTASHAPSSTSNNNQQ